MDILGIGPLEILLILIVILIVMGPNDIVKTASTIGKWLRKLMTSPGWRVMRDTSRQIRNLPNTLARQAGIDEMEKVRSDIEKGIKDTSRHLPTKEEFDRGLDAWTSSPSETKPEPPESGTGNS